MIANDQINTTILFFECFLDFEHGPFYGHKRDTTPVFGSYHFSSFSTCSKPSIAGYCRSSMVVRVQRMEDGSYLFLEWHANG